MNRVKPWGPPGHHCEWRRVAGLLFETLVQNGVGGQDFDKAVAEYKALVMLQPQTVKGCQHYNIGPTGCPDCDWKPQSAKGVKDE